MTEACWTSKVSLTSIESLQDGRSPINRHFSTSLAAGRQDLRTDPVRAWHNLIYLIQAHPILVRTALACGDASAGFKPPRGPLGRRQRLLRAAALALGRATRRRPPGGARK
jgi:hypothetical protein